MLNGQSFEAVEDRVYRLYYNKNQNRTDQFSRVRDLPKLLGKTGTCMRVHCRTTICWLCGCCLSTESMGICQTTGRMLAKGILNTWHTSQCGQSVAVLPDAPSLQCL
jgi:hypothetical protein